MSARLVAPVFLALINMHVNMYVNWDFMVWPVLGERLDTAPWVE
jgi:hypothetical protein